MELRNRATGAVITDSQLRAELANASLPKTLTPELLDSLGYDPILEGAQATIVPPYQTSVRDGIEQINGQWFTKYVAGPIFVDNDEATAAEQEAAYKARKDEEQAVVVRAERNKRLADCDWTQLVDAPVNASVWSAYRRALRDVPEQAGFPWEITWPAEPAQ